MQWLKRENIWIKVSPKEKAFLGNSAPDEGLTINMSWRVESALTLGWCLNKVKKLPKLDDNNHIRFIEELEKNISEISDSLILFFFRLKYRDLSEIYEENLLNESATGYFRDLIFRGKKDQTQIN